MQPCYCHTGGIRRQSYLRPGRALGNGMGRLYGSSWGVYPSLGQGLNVIILLSGDKGFGGAER